MNKIKIRTKKIAAAVLYLSPTRFRSVDMPAILALPKAGVSGMGTFKEV